MDDIFSYVVAGLESKEFGDEKFYFDKQGYVVAIEHGHGENFSYVVYDSKADGMFLYTEVKKEHTLMVPIDMRKFFIIPEINKRDDAELIHESATDGYENIVQETPKSIFLIVDFGIIADPKYKGCNFSNSLVKVAVQNWQGKVYSISFKVEEGVRGCDENLKGNIPNAFSMNSMAIKNKKGTLTIKI